MLPSIYISSILSSINFLYHYNFNILLLTMFFFVGRDIFGLETVSSRAVSWIRQSCSFSRAI